MASTTYTIPQSRTTTPVGDRFAAVRAVFAAARARRRDPVADAARALAVDEWQRLRCMTGLRTAHPWSLRPAV